MTHRVGRFIFYQQIMLLNTIESVSWTQYIHFLSAWENVSQFSFRHFKVQLDSMMWTHVYGYNP